MKIQTAFLTLLLSLLTVQSAAAAVVSRKDLEAIQMQVEQKSVEHKRLQAQAAKISVEMATVSKQMVQKARQIQNTEDRISAMEKQLARLQKELKTAEDDFIKEDENLIQTLYALQNLALKPTEALFVQPLTPVEIIRSAMLLRETVPFLAEEAAQIREKLDNIATKKRMEVVFDEELRILTAEAIRNVREVLTGEVTPPPMYSKACKWCTITGKT